MPGIEGQICIDLHHNNRPQRVTITSSRPVLAARILSGKTAEQVLTTLPLLFSICGTAQSRAALSAIQQTLNIRPSPEDDIARDILVLAENAKEHLIRIFLDWPKLFGLETDHRYLPYLSQILPAFKTSLFTEGLGFQLNSKLKSEPSELTLLINQLSDYLAEHIFHQTPESWGGHAEIEPLLRWNHECNSIAAKSTHIICEQGWASQGYASCEPLPPLEDSSLIEQFDRNDAADFIATPQWQQQCYENTALTRQWQHPLIQTLHQEFETGLITRWTARLVELAMIPEKMRHLQAQLSHSHERPQEQHHSDAGVSQVEAARGRLIHRIKMDHNIITDYQILAPTEWNFHPQGLIQQSLSSLVARDQQTLEQLARIVINTIDPCVGYTLRIH